MIYLPGRSNASGKEMPSRSELISKRKKELLALGYKPGIVDVAMDWATGSAEGMANYVMKQGLDGDEDLIVKFLPQYLNDCEKYMRSFGHDRGEVKSQKC